MKGECVILNADAYVDGSFSPSRKRYGSGVILIFEDGRQFKIHYGGVLMDKEKQKSGSLIGELKAAEIAISQALEMGSSRIRIFHDCMPVQQYAVAPPKDDSPEEIKAYNKRMSDFMKHIDISFEHVKAHSGNRHNMAADREARIGAGITAFGTETQTMAEKALSEKTDDLLVKYSSEDSIKDMAPVMIYCYAMSSGNSIRFSITESRKGEELKQIFTGAVSGSDPAELLCTRLMDFCGRKIAEGAKNITIITGFKNIVKYGGKSVNQNSRTVSEHYKKFSAFCEDARKSVHLSVELPECARDVEKYKETEAMAKEFAPEKKSPEDEALKGISAATDLICRSHDDEKLDSVKIYIHTATRNGTTAYSAIRVCDGRREVMNIGSSVSPEINADPAGFVCEVIISLCQQEISRGTSDITVYSKFSSIVSAASENYLSEQNEHFVRLLDFCREARKKVAFSIRTPETDDEMQNCHLAVRLNALAAGAMQKNSDIEKTFVSGRYEEKEEKEEKKEENTAEEKQEKNVTEEKAEEKAETPAICEEPKHTEKTVNDGEKENAKEEKDEVMEFLEISAEISRLQEMMEKKYSCMSENGRKQLEKIAGYIAAMR